MPSIEVRLARVHELADVPQAEAEVADPSAWDWYAQSCSCGVPPGECREHPRARISQRPPGATGESGLTWPAAAPARPAPGLPGFSSGSTTEP